MGRTGEAPSAASGNATMDKDILRLIDRRMDEAVSRGECVGVTAMVVRDGRVEHFAAAGMADLAAGRPMAEDTVFRMFSSTKCVTGVASAMCVERGILSPRTSVFEYLPGFRDQTYWDGRELRPVGPQGVTIHDLLNMTSGICYPADSNPGDRALAALARDVAAEIDAGDYSTDTVTFANRIGKAPLSFQPGAQWAYGFNADVMAAVIEVATGMRYGEFLRRELFEPLGMKDTGFRVDAARRARMATCYDCVPGREPTPTQGVGRRLCLANYDPRTAFESGGAGLVSTAPDWAAFMAMLQAGGTWRGHRFLSPAGMRFLTAPQLTAEQARTFRWQDQPGQNYGCFHHIKVAPGPTSNLCSVGTYGWDGALGTNSFVDPVERLSVIVMIQNAPPFGTRNLTWSLRNPAYAAL